ncbi:MAG TPA: hypothetical protein PLZ36_18130, partial [Armatimonadota bacterium]|nr:hypothetical protein [Armatimonadota bacterium]
WQAACASNQRQLVMAVTMHAQDHDEVLPHAATAWRDLAVERGLLACPAASTTPNGYVYLNNCAGVALGDIASPAGQAVIADGQHRATGQTAGQLPTYDNIAYQADDFAWRHAGKLMAGFLDGHVEVLATAPDAGGLPRPPFPPEEKVIWKNLVVAADCTLTPSDGGNRLDFTAPNFDQNRDMGAVGTRGFVGDGYFSFKIARMENFGNVSGMNVGLSLLMVKPQNPRKHIGAVTSVNMVHYGVQTVQGWGPMRPVIQVSQYAVHFAAIPNQLGAAAETKSGAEFKVERHGSLMKYWITRPGESPVLLHVADTIPEVMLFPDVCCSGHSYIPGNGVFECRISAYEMADVPDSL